MEKKNAPLDEPQSPEAQGFITDIIIQAFRQGKGHLEKYQQIDEASCRKYRIDQLPAAECYL